MPAGVIVAHSGLPKLHVVDVHVGGAHPELADVGVQGKLLIPGAIFENDKYYHFHLIGHMKVTVVNWL